MSDASKQGAAMPVTPHELANKPLVEAIFDARWTPMPAADGVPVDQAWALLPGRLSDRVGDEYPFYEPLPVAAMGMPADAAPFLAHYRFRVAPDEWPLIQLGPGIMTVNETVNYTWEDFGPRIVSALASLRSAHPAGGALKFDAFLMRYINAMPLRDTPVDVLRAVRDNLRMDIQLDKGLFVPDLSIEPQVLGLEHRLVFRSTEPPGQFHLRLASGEHEDEPALLFELTVQSAGDDMPDNDDLEAWPVQAHALIEHWFFNFISDDLRERFD